MSDDNLNFYEKFQKILQQLTDENGGFSEDFDNKINCITEESEDEIYKENEEDDNENKSIFKCPECGCENNDYISLVDHTMIYHDKYYKDEYVDDYINNNEIEENIDTSNGKFECIVCNQKYPSIYHLGEHFTNDHVTYETLNSLDNYIRKDGYPTFDVLRHLNMIEILPYTLIDKFRENNIKCNICHGHYHYSYKLNSSIKSKKITFTDDMELINYKNIDNINENIIKDDNNLNINKIITDEDLLSVNKEMKLFKHPINLTCCNNTICNLCLVEHLKNKNDIICIFCLKDFNKYDNKFVEIIEPDETNDSWQKWWKEHKFLFD